MLKIKTDRVLVDMKGQSLKDTANSEIHIGTILSNIMAGKVSNPTLGWILGKKFATKKVVDLKAEEVVFVKSEVEKLATDQHSWLSGLVAGQVLNILDGVEDEDSTDGEDKIESPENSVDEHNKDGVETPYLGDDAAEDSMKEPQ